MAQSIKNPAYEKRYKYKLANDTDFSECSEFRIDSNMVEQLLTAMGIPVIRAAGDGEATCASLELRGLVDATQSRDSDPFLFGSQQCIKEIRTGDNQFHQGFDVYRLTGVKISRTKLIALSLFSGCDFFEGVDGIGPKKFLQIRIQ